MISPDIKQIKIGLVSCGIAAGGEAVYQELLNAAGNIPVIKVGCLGHCYAEPLVEAVLNDGSSIFYNNVPGTAAAVENILSLGETGRFTIPAQRKAKELVKVLAMAGNIDPVNFEDYVRCGGYEGLKKALTMPPEAVVEEVKISGLRGRGGGGFSTGMKWSFLAAKDSDEKVIVCNADEGDPGAFMDRSLMESVPIRCSKVC